MIGVQHGIGPIVIGPRGSHQPLPYHHDTVHMVRHHNEFADVHVRHVVRYRTPTPLHQFTHWTRNDQPIRDVSEPLPAIIGANGQAIRALLGAIVSLPPDGSTLR